MPARILLTLALIISILTLSFTIAQGSPHLLPIKPKFENLSPNAQKQVECLAENMYFESAYEPDEGKIAVAMVTINRVKSGMFEDNICAVVKQKKGQVCQFSWWCETKSHLISTSKVLTNGENLVYNSIKELATFVYVNHDKVADPSKGALFYHADYVNPRWRGLEKSAVVGRHIFYVKQGMKI
jgi:spore germination cell wall hydrolase CwlJ-like protein